MVDNLTEDLTEPSHRLYECTVLYSVQMTQADEKDLLKNIENLFTETGAKQVAYDAWGRRGLAYPINGMSEGNIIVCHYRVDPALIREVDRQIRILPGVLRHLLITVPEEHPFIRYSERFASWQEEQKTHAVEESVRQEEKLKKRVIERVSKRATPEKPSHPKGILTEDALSKGIEKIISDKDINL